MKDGERRSKIEFPAQGMRAVSVPMESIEVRLGDGIIRSKDGNWSAELSAELDNKFEKARSMFIFTNVDAVLEDIWDEERAVQAGWIALQGIPEVEQFTIDLDRLNKELEPNEAQLQIVCFNTSSLQEIPNEKAVRMAKDTELTDVGTSWKTLFIQPGFPFEREHFSIHNTGSENLEVRYSIWNAGKKTVVDSFLDSNNEAVAPSEHLPIDNTRPADYLMVEVRAVQNTTNVEGQFSGEAN